LANIKPCFGDWPKQTLTIT